MLFYQELPVAVDRTVIRSATYRRPDECRRLRATRYPSGRIDQFTAEEDQMLTIWSCEAARSSGYTGVVLSDLEYGARTYHDELRKILPVLNENVVETGRVASRNAEPRAAQACVNVCRVAWQFKGPVRATEACDR